MSEVTSASGDTGAAPRAAEGGCLCGAVRYRLTGEPVASFICHCRTCRAASSAPSVAWLTVGVDGFANLKGTPRRYVSSPGVTRAFCEACGSPLVYANADDPSTLDVTTVSMDDPTLFAPTRELWLSHKIGWEAVNGTLDHHLQDSSSRPL
ncbi:MAG: hypothetical protein JWP52_4409 [Rhizobacter sp.]|nr:hypothetical protein [Rhizobacter sp.]